MYISRFNTSVYRFPIGGYLLGLYSNVTFLITIPSFSSGAGVGVEINSMIREGEMVGNSRPLDGVLKEALREPSEDKFINRK